MNKQIIKVDLDSVATFYAEEGEAHRIVEEINRRRELMGHRQHKATFWPVYPITFDSLFNQNDGA